MRYDRKLIRIGTWFVFPAVTLAFAGSASGQFNPPTVTVPDGELAPGAWPFRVSGTNMNVAPVAGSVLGGTDSDNLAVAFPAFGPIKWTESRHNEGDIAMIIGPRDTTTVSDPPLPPDAAANNYQTATGPTTHGWRVNQGAGLPWATVRANGQDNLDTAGGNPVGTFYGTANFSGGFGQGRSYNMLNGLHTNGGNGASDLEMGFAGTPDEASINVAVAFFPFGQGWVGGFVNATNIGGAGEVTYRSTIPAANIRAASPKLAADASAVTWQLNPATSAYDDGRAVVNLGTGRSNTEGMLFVASVDDDSNLAIASAVPNTTGGWNVAVREDSDFDVSGATLSTAGGGNNNADFAFLYLDYDTTNLIGGRINGATGAAFAGETAGAYTAARTAAGVYGIEVAGKTGNDGMLILSNADGSGAAGGLADRSFLSYQYDTVSGKFIVQAREGIGGGPAPANGTFPLTDSSFYFAWVDFNSPLTPVGEDFAWNVANGNYATFGDWSPNGRPTFIDNATVGNNGTVEIDTTNIGTDAALARDLSIGTTAGTGTVNVSGDGELLLANRLNVGDNGTGTLTQTGGRVAVQFQGGEDLHIGNQLGSVGVYNLNEGELAIGDDLLVGANGNGTLNVSGGTITRVGYFVIGDEDAGSTGGAAAVGVVNLTGGTINQEFGDVELGDEGTGTLNASGGTLNVAEGLLIGNRALGTGIANFMPGAIVTTTNFNIGNNGNGTLNMTGGDVTVDNEFFVGKNSGSIGVANFGGGTMRIRNIQGGAGTSTANFDGTSFVAGDHNPEFIKGLGTANVLDGGLLIDTSTFDLTVIQTLVHGGIVADGGLIKSGAGSLTLTGVNTFNGPTNVQAGTLTIANGGSIQATSGVRIAATATLALPGANSALATSTRVITDTPTALVNVTGTAQLAGRIAGPVTVAAPFGKVAGQTTLGTKAEISVAGLRQNSLSLAAGTLALPTKLNVAAQGGSNGLIVLNNTLDNGGAGTPGLAIGDDAALNIFDNDVVLYYSGEAADPNPTTSIQGYINNFYNSAAGVPLITSQGIIDTGGQTVFVAIDNAVTGFGDAAVNTTFYDLSLGNSTLSTGFKQTIIRYTWGGDYDLNGVVDALDYAVVDANLGQTVSTGGVEGWQRGDGDFDGMVTALDYSPIDANLGKGGPLSADRVVPAVVPEPSIWVLGSLAAVGLSVLGLRRRK